MKTTSLSHCLEDYLEAVYIINKDKKVVRVKELAEFLNVKTPSVVDAIAKLQDHSTSNPCSLSHGAKMSTPCLVSGPAQPPQTIRAFLGVPGPVEDGAAKEKTKAPKTVKHKSPILTRPSEALLFSFIGLLSLVIL